MARRHVSCAAKPPPQRPSPTTSTPRRPPATVPTPLPWGGEASAIHKPAHRPVHAHQPVGPLGGPLKRLLIMPTPPKAPMRGPSFGFAPRVHAVLGCGVGHD